MKKAKKVKLKNISENGSAKGKEYTFVETADGYLVPRDPRYPVSGAPGIHTQDGAIPVLGMWGKIKVATLNGWEKTVTTVKEWFA